MGIEMLAIVKPATRSRRAYFTVYFESGFGLFKKSREYRNKWVARK
jgi:hypothetical protein